MRIIAGLIVLCFFVSISHSFAQNRVELKDKPVTVSSLRWDIALLPGMVVKRGYPSDFVSGIETRISKKFADNLAWMASAGFTHFYSRTDFIIAKAGLQVFFTPTIYLTGEIGFGEFTNGGETFLYSPSLGFLAGKKWDFSIKYESLESTTNYPAQVALRIGYRLSK